MKHLINSCKCSEHRDCVRRGLSCSIDSLMDVYYYSIYWNFKVIDQSCSNELVNILNEACRRRDRDDSNLCSVRLPVWNWCVGNISESFSPQGRDDAEILTAFQFLGNQAAFKPTSGDMGSPSCMCAKQEALTLPIPVSATTVEKVHGNLSDAIIEELKHVFCTSCNASITKTASLIELPPVLMLELGVLNARNNQKPPVIVEEHLTVNSASYVLTGAVLLRPGHYFSIVKVGGVFYVVDDLQPTLQAYSCFSGAVSKDAALHQEFHTTSPKTPGIHLLIYVDRTYVTVDKPVFCSTQSNFSPVLGSTPNSSLSQNDLDILREQPPEVGLSSELEESITSIHPSHFRPVASSTPNVAHSKSTADQMTDEQTQNRDISIELSTITTPLSFNLEEEKSCLPVEFRYLDDSSGNGKHVADFLSNFAGNVTNVHLSNVPLPMMHYNAEYFVPCHIIFNLTKSLAMKRRKRGYKQIDKHMSNVHMDIQDHFIFGTEHNNQGHKQRLFVSLPAVISYLSQLNDDASLALNVQIKQLYSDALSLPANNFKAKSESTQHSSPVKLSKGVLHVDNFQVHFKVVSSCVYLSTADVFRMMDLESTVKKNGYRFIDACLKKHGIDPKSVFLFEGSKRRHFQANVFSILMTTPSFQKQKAVGDQLVSILFQELGNFLSTLKKIATPKRKLIKSNIEPIRTPKRFGPEKKTCRRQIMKNKQKKEGSKLIKSCLYNVFSTQFQGDKVAFFYAFSGVIVKSSKDDFDGSLSVEQLSSALESRLESQSKKSFLEKLVVDSAPNVYDVTPLDVTHISQNYSGVRLVEKFRQRLPGVFPTQRAELRAKANLKRDFTCFLLPRRTACGWMIDVSRLMDILNFKYFFLGDSVKHWKLYGDGREIGGRASTFVGISILNNEAALHGVKFQSSKIVYPFQIFYESDSRDNLEENLGYPAKSNMFFHKSTDHNKFYLSGDEMFLEAVLDGSGKLNPTSNDGWNLYSTTNKETKSETCNDFRWDCVRQIDREHPENIFDVVPTNRVVLCILHAAARCTEKLLYLEVLNVLSEANKIQERSGNGLLYKSTAIANLEDNINKRGVRQGNFRIHFKVTGAPEPISLNKDHAVAILHPHSEEFPHALHKVLPNTQINVSLPGHVKARLNIKDTYTQFDYVSLMWHSFKEMYDILRKDISDDITEEELSHFNQAYSDEDLATYSLHAERFYQLFCFRHTANALTPYMMKLIDHVPELMKTLPFPVARFQSEGGEHLNYEHNKLYFRQTTRHGGRNRPDPMLALLRLEWNNLYYDIHTYTKSSDDNERIIGHQFLAACTAHTAATTIQRFMKGYFVRKKLIKLGWVSYLSMNDALKASVLAQFGVQKASPSLEKPLSGKSFMLAGNLQNKNQQPLKHDKLKEIIIQNGGKIKGSIPCNGKGLSTKKCTVICTDKTLKDKKVPAPIFQALRKGWPIAKVDYIYECISSTKPVSVKSFLLNTKQLLCKVTKPVSLVKKHFSRAISLTSRLKLKEKRKKRKSEKKITVKAICRNAAQYFVASKVRSRKEKLSLQEHRRSVSRYFQDWRNLNTCEKMQVKLQWKKSAKYSL